MKKILASSLFFLKEEIWRIPEKNYKGFKVYLIRVLRIIILSIRGFREDKAHVQSSALTFFTLMSIVPVVAMAFAIANGFGFKETLIETLKNNFSGQEDVMEWIIGFANQFLENAKGGYIAGVSILVLLWSVIMVLGNVEAAFNVVWQIKKSRPFYRKFTDYMSIMIIVPILFLFASSITVVSSHIQNISGYFGYLLGPFATFMIKLLPYIMIWITCAMLYIIMPNTKVNAKWGIVAGIFAGTLFQIIQFLYIKFQIGVNSYGAIYGTFAALPLFLIWLRISWLIILFGAEISYSCQNVNQYHFEKDFLKMSNRYKRLISLLVTNLIVRKFKEGAKPPTIHQIIDELQIPYRIVSDTINNLVECRIISETLTDVSMQYGYQPAREIRTLTINSISDIVDSYGSEHITFESNHQMQDLQRIMNEFVGSLEKHKSNVPIGDIK